MIQARGFFQLETLMHRFLHTLAMAAVLVHMVCGCCWHHAHAAEHQEEEEEAHAHRGSACIGHDHAVQRGSCTHHDESLPHGDGCEEDACDFVRTDRDTSLEFSLGAHLPAVPASEAIAAFLLNPDAACAALPDPSPPDRLHLVHQALLL